METENINRAYLETLSFSDLSKLADEYGVDVPENFDSIEHMAKLVSRMRGINNE